MVVLARGTGYVTISRADTLTPNLDNQNEWFEPAPRLSHAVPDCGFLSLEVECKYQTLKRHISGPNHEGSGSDDDCDDVSDDYYDLDLLSKSAWNLKSALYYVTDIERFQPPRKKPRLVTRTYRLLCLKSTTSEELYTRKVSGNSVPNAL